VLLLDGGQPSSWRLHGPATHRRFDRCVNIAVGKVECRCCRVLDNLPVAMVKTRKTKSGEHQKAYERGFYVGFKLPGDVSGSHLMLYRRRQIHTRILFVQVAGTYSKVLRV